MLKEAIADEKKAGWKEYPHMSDELARNRLPHRDSIHRITTDERRHYRRLRKISKSLRCR
jgi:rubrerythrin